MADNKKERIKITRFEKEITELKMKLQEKEEYIEKLQKRMVETSSENDARERRSFLTNQIQVNGLLVQISQQRQQINQEELAILEIERITGEPYKRPIQKLQELELKQESKSN